MSVIPDGYETVCFVPLPDDESKGYLSVPVSGRCDIEWHVHLLRATYSDERSEL